MVAGSWSEGEYMTLGLRVLIAGAVIGVAALGYGCSDDGGGALTLEEYFAKLQALDDEFEDDSAALDSAFESEDLDEIKSALDAGTTSTGEFVDDVAELEPPEEVQETHDEAVAAGNELVEAIEAFNDEVQEAESLEALQEIDFAAIGDASERFNAVCLDMEAVASENNIELDLNCEDPSDG